MSLVRFGVRVTRSAGADTCCGFLEKCVGRESREWLFFSGCCWLAAAPPRYKQKGEKKAPARKKGRAVVWRIRGEPDVVNDLTIKNRVSLTGAGEPQATLRGEMNRESRSF